MKLKPRTIIKKLLPRPLLNLYRWMRYERRIALHSASSDRNLDALWHTSQAGQDYWVYGEVFNEKRDGFFLDIGAHDGVYLSNTLLLEMRYGWNGICIEGNPDTFVELRQNRRVTCVNICVDRIVGTVSFAKRGVLGGIAADDCDNTRRANENNIEVLARPLADILQDAGAPSVIDYMSIDIEGAEDRVLLQFPFDKYLFRCLTVERPSLLLRAKFSEFGYVLIKELPGLDCFYLHRSFIDDHHQNLIAFHKKLFRLTSI